MRVVFFFGICCFWFFSFLFSVSAQTISVDFLQPVVREVKQQLICLHEGQTDCYTLFLIKGKNFLNSNGPGSVRVAGQWAQILRWTDTFVVARGSSLTYLRQPVLVIDRSLKLPELHTTDPVLNELFEASVKTALASVQMDRYGNRYLLAGEAYQDPKRTYYRDSYWSSGLLLLMEPSVIKDQILLLASGVEPNGSVPSAIPVDGEETKIPLWADHYDSGPYFILLVADYIAWTGDKTILQETVSERTIYQIMKDILDHLAQKDHNKNLLPEKSKDSLQDWLDSIPRSGEVLSNVVLYKQALKQMGEMSIIFGEPKQAFSYERLARTVSYQINKRFWNEEKGYYYESCDGQVCVDRVTNESSLAALFEVIEEKNRDRFFSQLSRRLETRYNSAQPYGDWGVMNAHPLYTATSPYEYQNGADWPFLDGINAGARLKFNDPDWYYPLTRWWTYWQEKKITTASLPEYVSPHLACQNLQQAWSTSPAFSLIRYGLGIDPDINGSYQTKIPSWGQTTVKNIFIRGQRKDFLLGG